MKRLLLILLPILSMVFSVSSQSNFSKKVEKKDGRFISGRIDASEFSISALDRTGLVKEMHINIELWTLLGEPVEKYLFRWKRGSSVMASDYTRLDESTLAKYPDLLKRYLSLRPGTVELKYYVSTQLDPKYVSVKDLVVCGKKFINNLQMTKEATWGSNEGASGYREINSRAHFLITAEGATGNDIVPGSPKDWLDFIQWSDCPTKSNKTAFNTFKYANQMTFYGLEVTRLEVPIREIDAIAEAYNNREKKEKETLAETPDLNESMWESLDEADNHAVDDFGIAESNGNNDPWSSVGKSETGGNSWEGRESEQNADDPWSGVASTETDNSNFEIKQENGKFGVVNTKTGKTIFPFVDYRILDYKPREGIAKVIKYISSREIEVSCEKDGSVNINLYEEGYLDSSGNWLIDPIQTASITGRYEYWNGLLLIRNDGSDTDIEEVKREIKARDKKCGGRVHDKVDEMKEQYKSQGYKITEYFYRY